MFDLPTVEKNERKAASKFRNTLVGMGFEMAQFSVYMRFCTSHARIDTYCQRVEKALPNAGKVNILVFTDKQYEQIRSFLGKGKQAAKKTPNQYELF